MRGESSFIAEHTFIVFSATDSLCIEISKPMCSSSSVTRIGMIKSQTNMMPYVTIMINLVE